MGGIELTFDSQLKPPIQNPQTSSTGSDFHGPSKRHRTPLYSSALPATSTLSPDDLIPGYSSVSVPEDGSSQPLAKEASHTHQVRLLTRTDNSCRALRRRLRALCSLCCHSFEIEHYPRPGAGMLTCFPFAGGLGTLPSKGNKPTFKNRLPLPT